MASTGQRLDSFWPSQHPVGEVEFEQTVLGGFLLIVKANVLQAKSRASKYTQQGELGWAGDRGGWVGAGTRMGAQGGVTFSEVTEEF